jgi:hypothetical protein
MKKFKRETLFISLALMFALTGAAAMAADSTDAGRAKAKYKKVTGEVMSVTPNSIVIKGRKAAGPITLAVTQKTAVIGANSVKAGDRAAVNYRVEKNGNTATRINVLSASAAPAAAPASGTPSPKRN